MDPIQIPEQDIAALDHFAPDVVGLRILLVNLYAISRPEGGWVLIDTGLPHFERRILRWAEELFGSPPDYILLTHGHFDHAGAADALSSGWNVPVYVHPLELPYVTGKSHYPPPDPTVGGGLVALFSKFYPHSPVNLGDRARPLPVDGKIPGCAAWQWLHTPGHTPGHVSLFRDSDRVLIAGDALATTNADSFLAVATQRPELHGPPAYFTTDWDAARASVQRLADLTPTTVATGHGQPLAGVDVTEGLKAFARDFNRLARPERGRDASRPGA